MAPQAPPVDVVIPCYNAARFIAEALDSVFAQPFPVHPIVVDDGSSDDSQAIVERYGAAVTFYRQAHAGAAAARNLGVEHSGAEYLAFLDADDVWTADSLEARFGALFDGSGVDGVFGATLQFLHPGLSDDAKERVRFDPNEVSVRLLSALLLRRSSFRRVGAFDATLTVGEGVDWIARATAAGLVFESVSTVVLRRRLHDDNLGVRERARQSDYLRVLRTALNRRTKSPRDDIAS